MNDRDIYNQDYIVITCGYMQDILSLNISLTTRLTEEKMLWVIGLWLSFVVYLSVAPRISRRDAGLTAQGTRYLAHVIQS
jgi:hypothetical protein